jgi:hypothetical protein
MSIVEVHNCLLFVVRHSRCNSRAPNSNDDKNKCNGGSGGSLEAALWQQRRKRGGGSLVVAAAAWRRRRQLGGSGRWQLGSGGSTAAEASAAW